MKELKEAILNIYNNSTELKNSVYGFYFVSDKKATKTPYIRVETISGFSTFRMSGKDELFRVQFTIFTKDEDFCYEILQLVKNAFDDVELIYTNYQNIQCRSFNENGILFDGEMFSYVIEYEIIRAKLN